MQKILMVVAAAACSCVAQADDVVVAKAVSPNGRNEIRLELENSLGYSVWRDGRVRAMGRGLALKVRGRAEAFVPGAVTAFERGGTEATPFYKKASVSLAAKGCRVDLGSGFALELIARDDGVAYRWVTELGDEIIVENEVAPLELPSGSLPVWLGYPDQFADGDGVCRGLSNFESVSTNKTAAEAGVCTNVFAELPIVVKYPDGACLSVSESNQRDYPGWQFVGRGKASCFDAFFAREPDESTCQGPYHHEKMVRHDYLARTTGRRAFPWRLFMLAENEVKLCENDAPYALADPCELEDVSWIRPGLAQWEWWHNWNLKNVDFKAGKNTATYLHYIDFAAAEGVPYVIMDGGWSTDYRLMNAIPEIDLELICRTVKQKKVGIVLWMPWASVIDKPDEMFAKYASIGVVGLKLDGICRNDRFFTKYAEDTARIAAKYKLFIDYHGISKPSGLSRTFPNVLTYEGVHGLENTKWEADSGTFMRRCDFPKNDVNQFFVRMSAGAMDYTPGAMRNMAKDEYRHSYTAPGSCGTRVHQLALFALYESPLQMLCDSPSLYRENRECFDFLKGFPTVWDETVGLAGQLDEYVVCARRSGKTWYVGAITNWDARNLVVDTSFLGVGKWTVEIFEDGVNAMREATDYRRSVHTVAAGDKLSVKLAPGGGWVARFTCL